MRLVQINDALTSAGIAGDWIERDQLDRLGESKGAYALLLELAKNLTLDIARFDGRILNPGWYVYSGSAHGTGGLKARLGRHFKKNKTVHWHIDRLTVAATKLQALAVPEGDECELLVALLAQPEFNVVVPGFGSTDCRRCSSHLLRLSRHTP